MQLSYSNSPGLLTGVTGYIAVDHTLGRTILAFRGSHSLRNFLADFDLALVPTDICPQCLCHQGLYVIPLTHPIQSNPIPRHRPHIPLATPLKEKPLKPPQKTATTAGSNPAPASSPPSKPPPPLTQPTPSQSSATPSAAPSPPSPPPRSATQASPPTSTRTAPHASRPPP